MRGGTVQDENYKVIGKFSSFAKISTCYSCDDGIPVAIALCVSYLTNHTFALYFGLDLFG